MTNATTTKTEKPHEAIRRIRQERKLRLVDVSKLTGISPGHLCHLEKNEKPMSGDCAIALSRWSGLPLDYLYPPKVHA